jgi:putative transcriptional regulator
VSDELKDSDLINSELASAHPMDELLASYAVGGLTPALHALIASHLSLSSSQKGYSQREFVSDLEAAAALQFESRSSHIDVSDAKTMLEAILHSPVTAVLEPKNQEDTTPHGMIPAALRRFLGREIEDVKWQTVLPGVWQFKLDGYGKTSSHKHAHNDDHHDDHNHDEATLYWIRAGKAIPSHTHEGSEVTLVLKGAFSDKTGHYKRGDVCVAGPELDHSPVASKGEDCICFAVTDGRLRLTGTFGRMIERFRH